ncbi:MAG: benzoate-CoA ligase family protein [Acetobacteraceae bacterium]
MPSQDNATSFFVDRHATGESGARIAFRDPWRTLTYAGLRRAGSQFAGALAAAGVVREQRIALVMLDTIDFPIAFWGALRAGIIPVPINTLLTSEQTGTILEDSRAVALAISAPLLPALRPALAMLAHSPRIIAAGLDGTPPEVAQAEIRFADFLASGGDDLPPLPVPADEVAFWLYSSGSTGRPKGVRHVHGSLRATAETYGAKVLGIRPDDLVFSAAKLFFAYGLGNAMTFPMSVGAGAVLFPGRPTAEAVLATMKTFQPSIFAGVPTLYAALLAQPALGRDAGSARLRRAISAGEPLPEAIGRRWQEAVGVDILDGLGSTEMLHIFLSNAPGDVQYGTSGREVPGYEVRIVDENGTAVGDGETGELIVSGPSAADGYWNRRDQSRATFRGIWTYTGDTYVRNEDGTFRYCGRADDMMKVGGIWVSPFEVEAALMAHPAVLEAAVVGHPDQTGLIKPKAFIVLKPGTGTLTPPALQEDLKRHVKEKIGAWKYPRWIVFAESLPKTATGKIQRYKLRQGAPCQGTPCQGTP